MDIISRGAIKVGTVVSAKAKKTVVIKIDRVKYISKYKRYAREHSKIHAHVPDNIEVKVGDIVRVGETRKLSKTKSWIITELITSA
ncbi:30S ribosomal protein S17 [Candidatus Micrarchaeota archaeon]|nr:30S ribosomal protein S17 [Candidatus Micrarchaeota archaeon]